MNGSGASDKENGRARLPTRIVRQNAEEIKGDYQCKILSN